MGVAEVLVWKDMNEENLLEAIVTVINDPSYATNAHKFGSLLKDQINKPIDRTIWHIEHLIRNPNLIEHMRPPVHDLTWYQYFMLDVMAFLGSLIVLVIFILYKLVLFCCCRMGSNKGISDSKKKRN
jgi:glucuronosyltransferase